ncbi:MAG: hypothetical protein PHP42_07760 [Bacteroidota bacterium]|nr:hypothetical protein [Bacteroidota bacterium]
MQNASQLTVTQLRMIKNYVNDLFDKKIKILEKYYDVDTGLSLSEATIERLSTKKGLKKYRMLTFGIK